MKKLGIWGSSKQGALLQHCGGRAGICKDAPYRKLNEVGTGPELPRAAERTGRIEANPSINAAAVSFADKLTWRPGGPGSG